MWRKDKYYVLHGMTLNWWFTLIFLDDSVKYILGYVTQELTEDITAVIHLLTFCYLTQNACKLLFSKPPRYIFDRQFKQYQ